MKTLKAFTLIVTMLLITVACSTKKTTTQPTHTVQTVKARLLGDQTYRNFETDLREYTITPVNGNQLEVEIRDRHICHGSSNPDDACTAIVWRMNSSGKFQSREEYHFWNGLKVWTGRIDAIGSKEDYRQVASYGAGNPIPYVIATYPNLPHDRRLYFFQDQLNTLLKEIPPEVPPAA